jgi:amidohydrolase
MRVCAAIDAYRERTLALGEDIFRHPELGFKEKRTAAIVDGELSRLGIPHETGLAVTGIKGRLRGRNHTITAAVLGELDAVICRDHPAADCETGAAHCCGHFGQTATMLAVAAGFAQSGVMDELDGDLVLMATPAEEYVELEYRHHLQTAGDIGFFGGKQELIRVGAFDDVDMAMMVHAESAHPQAGFMVGGSGAGFVGKRVRYIGREAHAGGMPHEGINALNAAMIGLMSIHAQRETFKDQDAIRVHPIITKGGDLVNIVPADVRMETYVRGRTLDAILDANVKVNRALSAGAMAVGAEIEIEEVPGYLPMANDPGLDGVFRRNAEVLVGRENVKEAGFSAVSGDIGDLMHIMPAIIPSCGGFQGRAHARDFAVSDPEAAYILPAKAMAMTVIDLLADGAALGRKVKSDYHPAFTRSEYLSFWEKFTN